MNTKFFTLNKYYTWNIVLLLTIVIGTLISCKKKTQTDDNSLRVFVINNNGEQTGGTISVSWEGNNTTYPIDGSATDKTLIPNGIKVTLTATPSEGYIFGGWGNGLAGTDATTEFTMNGSKVVSAQFIKVFKLELTTPTNGTIKAYKDTTTIPMKEFDNLDQIPEGSKIFLIATPNTGNNDLLTWTDTTTNSSVKENTALKTSFVMDNHHQISATFATAHTFTYNTLTITGAEVDSFQASRYSGKIFAFRDPAFTDTIKNGSLVAQGLRVYAKAILPDNSFDVIWDISGTQTHLPGGKDTTSFQMPTSNFNFIANLQQQGYDITINSTPSSSPSPTLKYKYGKIENFTDYHNTTTGNTFKFPRGYTVTLQATTTTDNIWEWTTNVSSVVNTQKEQQVQLFINDVSQTVNVILTPI